MASEEDVSAAKTLAAVSPQSFWPGLPVATIRNAICPPLWASMAFAIPRVASLVLVHVPNNASGEMGAANSWRSSDLRYFSVCIKTTPSALTCSRMEKLPREIVGPIAGVLERCEAGQHVQSLVPVGLQ